MRKVLFLFAQSLRLRSKEGKNKYVRTGYRGVPTNATLHGPTLCEDIKGASLQTMEDLPSFYYWISALFASSER